MKIFIDTEFNGWGGQLLSLAMVTETGREFYERLPDPKPDSIDPWVASNVYPVFDREPIELKTFHNKLGKWLQRFDQIDLYADYPSDLEYFFASLVTGPGKYIRTPPLAAHLVLGLGDTAKVSHRPHNALADAYALQLLWLANERAKQIGNTVARPAAPGVEELFISTPDSVDDPTA